MLPTPQLLILNSPTIRFLPDSVRRRLSLCFFINLIFNSFKMRGLRILPQANDLLSVLTVVVLTWIYFVVSKWIDYMLCRSIEKYWYSLHVNCWTESGTLEFTSVFVLKNRTGQLKRNYYVLSLKVDELRWTWM